MQIIVKEIICDKNRLNKINRLYTIIVNEQIDF